MVNTKTIQLEKNISVYVNGNDRFGDVIVTGRGKGGAAYQALKAEIGAMRKLNSTRFQTMGAGKWQIWWSLEQVPASLI